ncbi:uncharacterized protein LOC113496515 [Trichoplusia ni]|uniref:Uncharacterized protein LOC113496515 n=1 Tax=Trichoplusia ni TaxID=7111 RepID=A0A7E5VTC0_TRINI|nr:uncharacterized protein LOC113496515 [Trichoplusia ni]
MSRITGDDDNDQAELEPKPRPDPKASELPILPEVEIKPSPPPISLCKCLLGSESQEEVIVSERKNLILSTVSRTENYLRERRIPELLRHLEAVVKSFDPGQRGWLSAGQVRRAFITLGLTPVDDLDDRIPTDVVLEMLKYTQENELYDLLIAGMAFQKRIPGSSSFTAF